MTDSLARPRAHLTEEERHGLADGSLAPDRRADAESHAVACADCAGDVARLHALMTRLQQPSDTRRDLDTLWPAIRARIERGKVVSLGAPQVHHARSWAKPATAVAAVAAVVILAFTLGRESRGHGDDVVATPVTGATPIVSVGDSSLAYQEEVSTLLEDLELRRAMMRPSTAASVDRDLRIIDGAIEELTTALTRDPNNPQLRQLLAASYRQKRDLLKQVDNAS